MSPCLGPAGCQAEGAFRSLGQSQGGTYWALLAGGLVAICLVLMPRPEAETEMCF